ncbi:MAG TPA: hypothetical protein VF072_11780 [Thermoleophilaceae bacterium]
MTEPPQTFTVTAFSAPVDSGDTVDVQEDEPGDGCYQYDFKTSKAWAGKCGTVTITTPHSGARSAKMQFKK